MRWVGGRVTFIIATAGVLIGLTEFFRYPTYMYTSGGFMFLFPYLVWIFVFGFPILLLELTVGQMFQRAPVGVFRAVHPRLIGVGISQAFVMMVFASYYCYLVGIGILYFAESFKSPLKWSDEGYTMKCLPFPSLQYYLMDVLMVMNDSCTFLVPGDISKIHWWLFFTTSICWGMVYGMIFKGTKSISYITWISVILP